MKIHTRFTTKRLSLSLLLLVAMLAIGCGEGAATAQQATEPAGAEADDHEGHGHEEEAGHGHDDEAGHDHAAHDEDEAAEAAPPEEDHEGHDRSDDEPAGGDHAHEEEGHEHGDGEHADAVQLTPAELQEFGIRIDAAAAADLPVGLVLPGEIVFDPNMLAHVTPRVAGVVQEVRKRVGDQVQAGDVLAVLSSRELAQVKSTYLAARARLELARANFERERRLFEQEIAPEAEFLQAKQALREAEVQLSLSERELHALGLNEQQVQELPQQDEAALTTYEMTAPIGGTIIERHLTQGEVVPEQPAEPPFVIADLDSVWVQLTVYPKNLGQVRAGQPVTVVGRGTSAAAEGVIDYVSPQVSEGTRTALARVVLGNEDGIWRPGQFVSGRVNIAASQASVVVPLSALQTVEGRTVVFVQTPKGFEPRSVEIGRRSSDAVEIVSGLSPGDRYAATNTFTLKAEMGRGLLEHAGHAH